MATTFQINNGDVTINQASGTPVLIGNPIGSDDHSAAEAKDRQDLLGGLSISRVISGAGAGVEELIGATDELGPDSVSMLLGQRIRDMFSAIINLQIARPGIRPSDEQFSKIIALQVFQDADVATSYRFRVSVLTIAGTTTGLSGTFSSVP